MVLQYFKEKEKIEKSIAKDIYKNILKKSNYLLINNNYFVEKNYKSSFEIVSILIILYIKYNIRNKIKNAKAINQELIDLFISDLDESLRTKGIGDMSIGKYVKSYVKKFYFRISKFPDDNNLYNNKAFIEYLKVTNLIKNEDYINVSRKFNDKFVDFINSTN